MLARKDEKCIGQPGLIQVGKGRLVNCGQFEPGYPSTERGIAERFDIEIHRFLLRLVNTRCISPSQQLRQARWATPQPDTSAVLQCQRLLESRRSCGAERP